MAASLGGFMQLSGAMFGSVSLSALGLSYREVFLLSAVFRALPLFMLAPLLLPRRVPAALRTLPVRVTRR